MILFHCATSPARPAVVLADRVASYGMIGQGVLSVEGRLRAKGVRAGQTVGLAVASPVRHLIATLAIYRLGAISVPAESAATLEGCGLALAHILADEAGSGRTHVLDKHWFGDPVDDAGLSARRGPASREAVYRVAFSSGTTGRPKAIGFSTRSTEERLHNRLLMMGNAGADRMMCLLNLNSNFGYGSSLLALCTGGLVGFADSALEAVQSKRARNCRHWQHARARQLSLLPTASARRFSSRMKFICWVRVPAISAPAFGWTNHSQGLPAST